ncbi:MAG: DEAD/DEAH box helicase family protein, partial [Rhodobacteraceae bacterium]|nr:DEAD/DEAH box helicase family protein [Paracoccaceae bacterium]
MFELRDYQHQLKNDVYTAWDSGHNNVIMQSATGSGKTVTFCDILREQKTPSVVTAHRSEIVSQISLALAEQQVPHNIIATDSLVKYIQRLHEQKAGRIWFNGNAKTTVGSVQTLTSKKRINTLGQWAKQQRLWVQDEGHHVLANNIFGKAHDLFVNARGLLPTATPCRADGKGLGRHADGVADTIVEGPDMRWLIDQGNLTDYRIFAPPTEIDFDSMKIGTTGDYTDESMKLAIRKSTIVGDVVT